MKIKKMVSALCLAAGLAIAAPAFSAIPGLTNQISTVQAADGWQPDGSYLEGNVKATGLKTIGGATYYFDANGNRVTGSVKLDQYTYYFHPEDGKLCTGLSGLKKSPDNPNVYYFFLNSKKGRVATNQWVKHSGKYFYADAKGQVKLGTIKVKGKLYHITPKGRMTSYGKSSYDNKYYNAQKNGILYTGLRKIKGKQYYFNPKTGARQTGTVKVGKSTFYFNPKTGIAKTGWQKAGNEYYYYLKNYRRAYGWQTISKKKYYFDSKKNGARVTSTWFTIGKNRYYFDSKGIMKTGFFQVDGNTYYADSKGIRKTGWQTVKGHKYYMDPKTGIVRTGWFTYKNQKYFLSTTKNSTTYGAARTGFVKIDGATYYFNTNGTMKTGWLTSNMKKYYFDLKTGKMLTGKHTIDKKTYDFGKYGYIKQNLTGPWSIKVKAGTSSSPDCYVVVYRGDTPIKAFVCSTARDGVSTPVGTHRIMDKLYWHELQGPTWGQYCSHITADILFHSVPNTRRNDPYSLETWEYNKLGKPASAGCIRLSVKHAKWLFDNVPVGTPVTVSHSVPKPKDIEIEVPPQQSSSKYYDPTDTFSNPYSVR